MGARRPDQSMARRVVKVLGDRWSLDDTVLTDARIVHTDGCAIKIAPIGYGLLSIALDLRVDVVITEHETTHAQIVARRIVEDLIPVYGQLAPVLAMEDAEAGAWQEERRTLLNSWAPGPSLNFDMPLLGVTARWENDKTGSAATAHLDSQGRTMLTFEVPHILAGTLVRAWHAA